MKKLLIGLVLMGSISIFAKFEELDNATLAITSRNGDIAPSLTISVLGIQAKKIYDTLNKTHASRKSELNDSFNSKRIESHSQEVICIKQHHNEENFYSCTISHAL